MNELPQHIVEFDQELARFEGFSQTSLDQAVIQRRILGILNGIDVLEGDVDEKIIQTNNDLDFDILKTDQKKLLEILRRFFKDNDVEIVSVFPYFDRISEQEKPNVLVITLIVKGVQKTCFLKYMDESPRREALGLRVHNLLSDSPIPFMTRNYTSIQMGIRGIAWDIHYGFESDQEKWTKFALSLGKADEFCKAIELGDRKSEDLLVLGTRAAHVDFGASFSRHNSLKGLLPEGLHLHYELGRKNGRTIIASNAQKNKHLLDALLNSISPEVVEKMNEENKRGLYPITVNPAEIVRNYLKDLDLD